jgi:hypothetical protein
MLRKLFPNHGVTSSQVLFCRSMAFGVGSKAAKGRLSPARRLGRPVLSGYFVLRALDMDRGPNNAPRRHMTRPEARFNVPSGYLAPVYGTGPMDLGFSSTGRDARGVRLERCYVGGNMGSTSLDFGERPWLDLGRRPWQRGVWTFLGGSFVGPRDAIGSDEGCPITRLGETPIAAIGFSDRVSPNAKAR